MSDSVDSTIKSAANMLDAMAKCLQPTPLDMHRYDLHTERSDDEITLRCEPLHLVVKCRILQYRQVRVDGFQCGDYRIVSPHAPDGWVERLSDGSRSVVVPRDRISGHRHAKELGVDEFFCEAGGILSDLGLSLRLVTPLWSKKFDAQLMLNKDEWFITLTLDHKTTFIWHGDGTRMSLTELSFEIKP